MVKIQVKVFWIVTRSFKMLVSYYMVSQPRRPQFESSIAFKWKDYQRHKWGNAILISLLGYFMILYQPLKSNEMWWANSEYWFCGDTGKSDCGLFLKHTFNIWIWMIDSWNIYVIVLTAWDSRRWEYKWCVGKDSESGDRGLFQGIIPGIW